MSAAITGRDIVELGKRAKAGRAGSSASPAVGASGPASSSDAPQADAPEWLDRERHPEPPRSKGHSPARGLLVAAGLSIPVWWAIIKGVSLLLGR